MGRVLRIKKFCGIRCRFDFFGCEMPTVLSSPFFFIINCLFTCFDRISALSVKSGCHIKPARGTRNFDIMLFSSGNRTLTNSTRILLNMEKTVFIRKRKMNYLERWYFIIGKSMHMEYRKIPLYKRYLLPQSPVYRKEKEP